MARVTKAEKKEAIERLKEVIKPGDTLHLVLRSVSRSGMCRRISVKKIAAPNRHGVGTLDVFHLDYNINLALGKNPGDTGNGVRMDGCGMDMGFALVYDLSYTLFPGGYRCTGKSCMSSDHANGMKRDRRKNHKSGGYAINHRWL